MFHNFIVSDGLVVHNSRKLPDPEKTNLQSQVDYLSENVQGFSDNPAVNRQISEMMLNKFYQLDTSGKGEIVFGGSRVRGNSKFSSDIDIGFKGLTEANARTFKNFVNKRLNKLFKTSNRQYVEHSWIVSGKECPGIPKIKSPQEFFMRTGKRIGGEEL